MTIQAWASVCARSDGAWVVGWVARDARVVARGGDDVALAWGQDDGDDDDDDDLVQAGAVRKRVEKSVAGHCRANLAGAAQGSDLMGRSEWDAGRVCQS
jgi:hypothetical protein